MSNQSEQPLKLNASQNSQTQNSSSCDQKKSAPDYPPATEESQRTVALNCSKSDADAKDE